MHQGVPRVCCSYSAEHSGNALSASAFASGSPSSPARVCTTRLATVVVGVHDPGARGDLLGDLVDVALGGSPVPMSRNWTMPASAAR